MNNKSRETLISELRDLYKANQEFGWDGYDGIAMSLPSLNKAIQFIELLPDNIIPPEAIPTGTGYFVLNWWKERDRILTLVFHDKYIIYAGIFEYEKFKGEESFEDNIPVRIISLLDKYFKEDK